MGVPMLNVKSSVAALAIGALAACAPTNSSELSPAQRVAIQDSVRTAMSELATKVNANGFTEWLPYLEHSDRFVWSADGEIPFSSADSLARFITDFSATLTHTELAWMDQRVGVLGPGLAIVTTPYREMYVGKKNDTTRVAGVFVGVWASAPSGWKLVSGNTSHAQPAGAAH